MPETEERRARAAYALFEDGPRPAASGEGEAIVSDAAVSAGPISVEFLDVESVEAAGHAIQLHLWPRGRLEISRLGRRFDTFASALREARHRARVAGMLAHGIGQPLVFRGSVLQPPQPGPTISGGAAIDPALGTPANVLVYPTHVTVAPDDGDPFQIPLGAVASLRADDAGTRVEIEATMGRCILGMLGRTTDAFLRAAAEARDAQGRKLMALTGLRGFSDGAGVSGLDPRDFRRLNEAFAAPARSETAATLLARVERGAARIGFVDLLDPDEEALAARTPLPENTASFLLAPIGRKVVLEVLAGPSAATYVFEGEIEAINRDLQALHFRRRPLSLTEAETEGMPGRPYRLALRKLEPLRRLRAAITGRIVHNEGWVKAFQSAIA